MNRPSFLEGALVALLLAMVGGAATAVLIPLLGAALVCKALVATLAGVYLGYLLRSSREKTGRVVVPCLWLMATLAGCTLLSLPTFVVLQTGSVWLVRTLYFHGGVLASLTDLGLNAMALAAAAWALGRGSWLLAVWSFFLMQALFVWIRSPAAASADSPPDHGFEAARALAQTALERLATGR